MLSDEEKEALEILKGFEPDDLVECAIYLQALEKITNLIEKQSKEIEELKNADLTTVYLNGVYDGEKKVQDKIKAKIEEVNAEELNIAFIISGVEYKEAITSALQSLLENE